VLAQSSAFEDRRARGTFTSPLILSHLKTDWAWLRDQVLTAIRRGDERAAIHESNLIPPDLLARQPDAHQPYYTTSCASM
jgi:hypothetical protein